MKTIRIPGLTVNKAAPHNKSKLTNQLSGSRSCSRKASKGSPSPTHSTISSTTFIGRRELAPRPKIRHPSAAMENGSSTSGAKQLIFSSSDDEERYSPTGSPPDQKLSLKTNKYSSNNRTCSSPVRTIENNTPFSPVFDVYQTRGYMKRLKIAFNSNENLLVQFPNLKFNTVVSEDILASLKCFIESLPSEHVTPASKKTSVLPTKKRNVPKHSLVLDLDETLVHCSLTDSVDCDFSFNIEFEGEICKIYVKTRPYMMEFIKRVSEKFELILFTASLPAYANNLMDILDRDRLIKHRLFRNSCSFVNYNYVKDLSTIGRDLSKTAIIDNSPQAFSFQLSNGIPIKSWYGDPSDMELVKLLPFLEKMLQVDDVRDLITEEFGLSELIKCF